MQATALFPEGWIMCRLPGIRAAGGTYELYAVDSLPIVSNVDSNLSWLTPLHPMVEEAMRGHRLDEQQRNEYAETLNGIVDEARRLGLVLPLAFMKLIHSFELQDRIPSCTACYFDLSKRILESPFRDGDYLIRFLNDQQVCVCWYLYVPHDETPFILASSGDGEEPFLDEIDFEARPNSVSAARANSALVARSFEEFVYRFWIENSIGMHLYRELPLTEPQLKYAKAINPTF